MPSAFSSTPDGTLPNNNYNRLIFKPDLTFQILKNLKVQASMQYTQTNIKNPQGGTDIWQSQASRVSPITAIKEQNGLYGVGSSMVGNPIAGVNESGYSKERHKEMLAIFSATYTPIKNWNINANVSTYTHDQNTKDRVNTYYLYDAEGNVAKTENLVSSYKETEAYSYRTMLQFTSDYTMSIADKHNLKFLVGYSQEYQKQEGFWASRDNLPFDGIDVIGIGGEDNKQNGNTTTQDVAIQSWFGRVNYDYDGKYLFEASLRADGSSRFAEGHRWGVFPSFSAGWNLHREDFMQNASSWLSELKIRGSWGTLGDAEKVGYYPTAQVLAYDPGIYTFGGVLVSGAYNNVAVNPDITWETSHSFNTGFDFAFWGGKLSGSVEYFSRKTTDMLYFKPVAPSMGYSRFPENVGSMINRGVELDLNSNIVNTKDFTWDINFNLTHFKNEVLELAPELNGQLIDGGRIYREGESMYQLYLPKYVGVNPETGESQWALTEPNEAGETVTTSYSEASSNRFATGDILPKVYGGFGTSLTFHGFDFSIAFAYQLGGRILDYTYQSLMSTDAQGSAWHVDMLNAWTPENTNTNVPRMNVKDLYTSNLSDRWLTSSDYLSLQNITFGYTLPKSWTRKLQIDGIRLYFVADNVALWTARKGLDPRQGYVAADNVYSPIRTISGGISLNF